MEKGFIVFLNGTSSSGKTSISNSIIELSDKKFLQLSIDEFAPSLFQSYIAWLNTKYPQIEKVSEENERKCVDLLTPPVISLFHTTIRVFSEIGINVIVDHVAGANKDWLMECIHLLEGYPVVFVGVKCSLEELEKREKSRGDRDIGLASSQFHSIHSYGNYEIEVHTDKINAQDCARLILEKMNDMKEFKAFQSK